MPLLHTGKLSSLLSSFAKVCFCLQGAKHFRPADCVRAAVLGKTEAAAKAKKAEDKAAAKEAKDKAKEDAAEEKRQSQILEAGDNPMAESDEEGKGDEGDGDMPEPEPYAFSCRLLPGH